MIEKTIQEISTHFTEDLKVTEEIIQISEDCISEIDHCIEQVSDFDHLFKLLKENINHYINVHGILACYIAKNIMESLDWATHEHIEKLTYSFFFQDITLVPLFIESESLQSETDLFVDLKQPRNIKDVLLYHAQKAAEIVREFPNLPIGIDSVITQHHGSPTGFGIAPDPQDNISPIAKVSIIAERFVEEAYPYLMDESFNQEIKMQIVSKLKEKFSKKSYKKLVDLLAELPF